MSIFGTLIQNLLGKLPTKQAAQPTFAGTTFNPNAQSFFDLIRAPQQAQFNVTAASGTKPKNYTPTAVTMNGLPAAAVFSMPAANPLPDQVFQVTAAKGTKPKNYQPTKITMNAPTVAGPQAMQQMLQMMGGYGASPFAPYGQG